MPAVMNRGPSFSFLIDARLKELFWDLARRNRRSVTQELTIAVERHLAAAGVKVPTLGPRRGRGRPKSAQANGGQAETVTEGAGDEGGNHADDQDR